jgi:hypothetical protein
VSTQIRYADITGYLTAIMNNDNASIDQSPHGQWWLISYQEFTTGQVPNVGVQIMDTTNPLQSAFYVILTDPNGYQGIPQMPEQGPFITDAGYTATLADGTKISGAQIAANIKSWLENGFPQ